MVLRGRRGLGARHAHGGRDGCGEVQMGGGRGGELRGAVEAGGSWAVRLLEGRVEVVRCEVELGGLVLFEGGDELVERFGGLEERVLLGVLE